MQLSPREAAVLQIDPIRIGVSACLLGHPVRYDGRHKLSRLCTDRLGRHFQLTPICPEEAVGLGTPRPPINLVGDPAFPRAVGVEDAALDVTDALRTVGERAALKKDICGFILMQKSPSCGMQGVRMMNGRGGPAEATGTGVFAAALMQACPDLPVEEEGRLADPVLLENFISRVYVYAHWQRLQREGLTRQRLLAFHQRYKYQLMATHREQYQHLGRAVAESASMALAAFAPGYFTTLMRALKQPATRGSHCNVLQHLAGYLKRDLNTLEKQALQQRITQYRIGDVPLSAPIALLKSHFSQYPDEYIAGQAYLQPHPVELGLYDSV